MSAPEGLDLCPVIHWHTSAPDTPQTFPSWA